MLRRWLLVAALLASCGESTSSDPSSAGGRSGAGGSAAGAAGSSSGAAGSISLSGAGGGGGGSAVDPCGDVGKVIYVVSSENNLLRFDPKALTFSLIGALKCPAASGDTPFSMAVNRQGIASVLFVSGNIFEVSTFDASCKPSGYKPNQQGWELFGMGYVADKAGSASETLFIIDGTNPNFPVNKGLGTIDASGKLSPVGQFSSAVSGRTAEVTGLGDGRLFAFFVDSNNSQASVAEINKISAALISNVPQPLPPPILAWAFAHWGGSFYLFNGDGGPSRVHKFTPGKGTSMVVANAGQTIVGAGVSTCAPFVDDID